MNPTQTTQLSLRFASELSPWWLLLGLPILALAAWRLYRREWPVLGTKQRYGLLILRLLLLGLLLLAAFRPSLAYRRVLTYPGRIILALDDSRSMTARDTAMPGPEALRLARLLDPPTEQTTQAYHQIASALVQSAADLSEFERFSRQNSDRQNNAFWNRSSQVQLGINQALGSAQQWLKTAPALSPRDQRLLDRCRAELNDLPPLLEPFFIGSRQPGEAEFQSVRSLCLDLAGRFEQLQGRLDSQELAKADSPLHPQVQAIRDQTRLELVAKALRRQQERLRQLAPDQYLQVLPLGSGKSIDLANFDGGEVTVQSEPTDLLGPLVRLAGQDSPFPLTGIVLLSDGRHLGNQPLAPLRQLLSRKSVPLHSAGVGSVTEPYDLAILQAQAPPVAVAGREMILKLQVKAAMVQPQEVRIKVTQQGQTIASAFIQLGQEAQQLVRVPITPTEPGLKRWTVELEPIAQDAFPQQNNRADVAVQVRDQPLRVLMLDYRPRWQTRFVLNILQRLPYVDLNSIIVQVHPQAQLPRGQQKGTWPADAATMSQYDLVILGELPGGLLSEQDWANLRDLVNRQGKTLGLLAPGSAGVPGDILASSAPATSPASAAAPQDQSFPELGLSTVGRYHPITGLLQHSLPLDARIPPGRLSGEAITLLSNQTASRSLISLAPMGAGKLFLLDDPYLWKWLNPRELSAHGQVFTSLVTWSVQGGFSPSSGQGLALDQQSFLAREGMQVWGRDIPAGSVVLALRDQQTVAQAPIKPWREGSRLGHAVFDRLPAADLVFALKDQPQTTSPPVLVIDDDRELNLLARDGDFLRELAQGSGGQYRDLADMDQFLMSMKLKTNVQKLETIWSFWDSPTLLAVLVVLLTVEWVWRKLAGLV